jgi:hypothetical protein
MSTATFDAIDMALLALIGVATPLIFLGGIGLAYRAEQRTSAKKAPGAGQHATEHGHEQRDAASVSARNAGTVSEAPADAQRPKDRVDP